MRGEGEIEVSAASSRTCPNVWGGQVRRRGPRAAGTRIGIRRRRAWRGALCHRVEVTDGIVTRMKVVDPSWFNWPALLKALTERSFPDFPSRSSS